MNAERSVAPWTDEQVQRIRSWQYDPQVHPFTCPYRGGHGGEGVLIPTRDYLACPDCSYQQYWVHDFMAG